MRALWGPHNYSQHCHLHQGVPYLPGRGYAATSYLASVVLRSHTQRASFLPSASSVQCYARTAPPSSIPPLLQIAQEQTLIHLTPQLQQPSPAPASPSPARAQSKRVMPFSSFFPPQIAQPAAAAVSPVRSPAGPGAGGPPNAQQPAYYCNHGSDRQSLPTLCKPPTFTWLAYLRPPPACLQSPWPRACPHRHPQPNFTRCV